MSVTTSGIFCVLLLNVKTFTWMANWKSLRLTSTCSLLRSSSPFRKQRAWRSVVCLNQSSLNPSVRVQVLTFVLLFLCLPSPTPSLETKLVLRVSNEQHRKGDKNTNNCDLLLIVHHRMENVCVCVGGVQLEQKIHCKLNCLCLSSNKKGEKKKHQLYDRGHKWPRHNNLQPPVWEGDKPSLKGLIDTNYSFLKLSPHWSRTSASEAGAHWP